MSSGNLLHSADGSLATLPLAVSLAGCGGITAPHSSNLLPPEVVLYEPSDKEVFLGGVPPPRGQRSIFLNTPLTDFEQNQLRIMHGEFDEAVESEEDREMLRDYFRLHALRALQFKKYKAAEAVKLLASNMRERIERLPVLESEVLQDLRKGFCYWHGRDKSCRPCLVLRFRRLGDLQVHKRRAVALVIFVLEYAVRYCMAPGRVENWVVLVDLSQIFAVLGFANMRSLVSTAQAIATTLENVYCARMAFLKIVYLPAKISWLIDKVIPADKRLKVSVVRDKDLRAGALLQFFEAHQLERAFGGTAPDLNPEETYPFKFFPNATGNDASSRATSPRTSPSTRSIPKGSSGNGFAKSSRASSVRSSRRFHEGLLWDTSIPEARETVLLKAREHSLTRRAAEALTAMLPGDDRAEPCTDLVRWEQLAAPTVEEAETEAEMDRMLAMTPCGGGSWKFQIQKQTSINSLDILLQRMTSKALAKEAAARGVSIVPTAMESTVVSVHCQRRPMRMPADCSLRSLREIARWRHSVSQEGHRLCSLSCCCLEIRISFSMNNLRRLGSLLTCGYVWCSDHPAMAA